MSRTNETSKGREHTYRKARPVKGKTVQVATEASTGESRTITVKKLSGKVVLRFAPRNATAPEADTSSAE